MKNRCTTIKSALVCAALFSSSCFAQTEKNVDEPWASSFQITNVTQMHPAFGALYSGANSMDPQKRQNETTDITWYLGRRLWRGGELWLNPEIDQGFGLSNTLGMAAYPSGEAYKVGANTPYLRLPRAFVRHTFEFEGLPQKQDAASNQFASNYSDNNLVLTLGHFSVVDVFDTNAYAHDPRGDFLNWGIIDAGAFDYAADSWGFTNGLSVERNFPSDTWRFGVFQMSAVPNAKIAGLHFHQQSWVLEYERRLQFLGQAGKWKWMAYVNRADMARYSEAVSQNKSAVPDVSKVRRFQSKAGMSFNLEQALSEHLGFFLRASAAQGDREAYEFTEISRSISTGLQVSGSQWQRPQDKWGIATVYSQLATPARAYLRAGGIGILIGDGNLRYGPEQVLETYYSYALNDAIRLSFDVQRALHPAYNRDRGPITFYGLRFHAEM